LPSLIPYIWLHHAILVPQSFYYDADRYEERLESYPFSRRLRVLYHKPEFARNFNFAHISSKTKHNMLKLMIYNDCERERKMSVFDAILGDPEIRKLDQHRKQEVNKLIEQLIVIGVRDDYLSLNPGGPFDIQCHHREAKDIGKRLYEIGGVPLMLAARKQVKRKLKAVMAEHLDYCWKDIGEWQV